MAGDASRAQLAPVFDLAGRQHDVILTRQLRAMDVPDKFLARMVRVGWLVPVRPGAWTTCRQPSAWQHAVAVALLAGPDAALSHATAARMHRFAHLHYGAIPEITVVYPRNLRLSGVSVHRVASLEAGDVQVSRGIRITTPARTLADLAARLPESLLVRVFDEALISQTLSADGVEEVLARSPSRRGVRLLRRLVEERRSAPAADSVLEVRVIEALGPLRPFEVHYQLTLDGELLILDLAWPGVKVAIECDGWASHSRSRSRFDRDRRRDNLLVAHGWVVGHVTSAMSDSEILRTAVGLLTRRATAPA